MGKGESDTANTGQGLRQECSTGGTRCWDRQVTIKKVDSTANLVLLVAEGTNGPDGALVVLSKFGDYVTVVSNGAQWYETDGRYDRKGLRLDQPRLSVAVEYSPKGAN